MVDQPIRMSASMIGRTGISGALLRAHPAARSIGTSPDRLVAEIIEIAAPRSIDQPDSLAPAPTALHPALRRSQVDRTRPPARFVKAAGPCPGATRSVPAIVVPRLTVGQVERSAPRRFRT